MTKISVKEQLALITSQPAPMHINILSDGGLGCICSSGADLHTGSETEGDNNVWLTHPRRLVSVVDLQ